MCIQTRLYTAGGVTTSFDELERHAPTFQSFLLIDYQEAASSLASLATPSHLLCPMLPAPRREVTVPFEAYVGPWSLGRLATRRCVIFVAVMTSALDSSVWSFQSQTLAVLDVGQPGSITPKDGWKGTIQTGFCRWSDAYPMKLVDLRWSMTKAVEPHPRKMGMPR